MANDVRFRKTAVTPPPGGCDWSGVSCIGNGRMLAMFYNSLTEYFPHLSEDNGQSWTQVDHFVSDSNSYQWGGLGVGVDTYLQGVEGPFALTFSSDDAIVRTADAGQTWASAVNGPELFDIASGDFWDFNGFVDFGDGTVMAMGAFTSFGVSHHLLFSGNNGLSFDSHTKQTITPSSGTLTEIRAGAYLGNDRVIVGGTMSNRSARVWRSIDHGTTWTEVIFPNAQHGYTGTNSSTIDAIVSLGNSVVLASGSQRENATSTFPPKLWRSTDNGENWTEITDSLPGWSTLKILRARAMVHVGDGRVVLGITGRPNELSSSNWRYSDDYGATWSTCALDSSYTNSASTQVVILYMAAGDNGNVACTLQSGTSNSDREIWVGIPSGFTGSGPCASFAEATPEAEEEEVPQPALSGRNSMLVLSAGTGKWSTHDY